MKIEDLKNSLTVKREAESKIIYRFQNGRSGFESTFGMKFLSSQFLNDRGMELNEIRLRSDS
jgi:hypothetical protein